MDTISDLAFFSLLIRQGSLSSAARELGLSTPAVSKRLQRLERRLGVRLLNRTTRRIALTHEGELYLREGNRILADVEELEHTVGRSRDEPRGLLRINATLGFGRHHIAPALSDFLKRFPAVQAQLHLTDRPASLLDESFDVCIRIGDLPDARLTARKIASNRRLLCASPIYLKRHAPPASPRDLARHPCIVIRESDTAYGTWHLRSGTRAETVKVRGPLSANDGESALYWALEGHGIIMRSEWEVGAYLRSGRLVAVLEEWHTPSADIFALYPERQNLSAKTTAFVDFLAERFAHRRRDREEGLSW
ncbi:MAG: LysR substrate-binding domain-containing protein [Pigmentiphaga sp.]|jgi:DNA-binding transcriptional LysR family regulator|uniref:LysR substrate-binding domain-containing protein n=1 Tax=unclassified Pigmentiphaga TaxID=2626614 RepID=UPI000B40B2A4|nr:LysR substrate-binding domain-containing protein [Pigmentiphaga sp. NML030171]OVZ65453.1 LysR family transcriptional regulator [Pigmentiphaga sp. NML030171]